MTVVRLTRTSDIMDILIVYGTTERQTQKIAEWTAIHVRERGHQVELRDIAASTADLNLETFHAFIIAASVHQQHHQETATNFVIAHHKLLNAKPSAVISVSLSAVLERAEAQRYVDHFVSVTGVVSTHHSPSRRCFALHPIRLLPRADRQIHRHERRRRSTRPKRSRVH